MKMSWFPEGGLQFGVFSKKGQQLKYVGKESTHTPSTLRAILLGVLNRLAKITSRKHLIRSEGVETIYLIHTNYICKAGLATPNLLKMGDLWSK